jgi:RNA polymerase sigma factor (sigma-70 family)
MDSGGNLKQEPRQSQSDFGQAASEPLHQTDPIQHDQALVQRLLLREEAAWTEFVTRYDRLIRKRARAACVEANSGVVKTDVIAEICGEVYAALVANDMRSLRRFSGDGRLSTWLWTIARRIALRYLSRLRKLPANADPELIELAPERPAAEPEHAEKLRCMQAARKQLSPNDQRVLDLFYDQRMSYEQVAEELQLSVNAVGPKLDRARRRLRSLLERPPDG